MNNQKPPFFDGQDAFVYQDSIENIQRKSDGSFLLQYNGRPFHATVVDTPEIYEQVVRQIETGKPVFGYIEPQPSREDLDTSERFWRDRQINNLRWLRERHRDQLEQQVLTSLTTEQFNELLTYVQQLRDWPQSPAFPDSGQRPGTPAWLSTLLN